MSTFAFYGFAGIILVCLFVMVITRKVMHAALALLGCLVSVAGIFAVLSAEVMAVIQLMVYAGGILILILFGIMLTGRLSDKPLQVQSHNVWVGVLAGALMLFLFIPLADSFPVQTRPLEDASIQAFGITLFSTYAFAFELSGLLLLVSLIAAAVAASSRPS